MFDIHHGSLASASGILNPNRHFHTPPPRSIYFSISQSMFLHLLNISFMFFLSFLIIVMCLHIYRQTQDPSYERHDLGTSQAQSHHFLFHFLLMVLVRPPAHASSRSSTPPLVPVPSVYTPPLRLSDPILHTYAIHTVLSQLVRLVVYMVVILVCFRCRHLPCICTGDLHVMLI